MRRDRQAAKKYARALFQVATGPDAESTGKPEKLLEELKVFQSAIETHKDLQTFFFNPVISDQEKFEVMDSLSAQLVGSLRFLKLLIENDRLGCLRDIIHEFESYKEEQEGVLSVELEVAHQPSEESLNRIRHLLLNEWKRRANFHISVNREIVGGFVAKASGKIFDASVRSQLSRMKESLTA